MTKTMEIKGMMCPHCEATVKKAIEAVAGVTGAEVSHEKAPAVVAPWTPRSQTTCSQKGSRKETKRLNEVLGIA